MTNRDIKFRAWDKLTKKFIDTGFHILGEIMAFGLIDDYVSENNPNKIPTLERYNDVVIQQFTGLLDKNDKEIYEGDVLLIPDNDPTLSNENTLVIVEWKGSGWAYRDTFNKNLEIIYGLIGDAEQDDLAEVIGNIFENPELTKNV